LLAQIMSCALLPVCTEWSSVAWRSWISGKRDSDSSLNEAGGAAEPHRTDRSAAHDHDQQQALDAESARAMGRWWRKHVVDDERVVGTVTLKSQALRELTTSVGDLRAVYLWRLIERFKRERWRKRLRGTRPTTLVITAWPRGRSLPHWAEKIAAILARNNQAASEAGGYNSERAKEARQEVRRFVLHDAALRPHIKHLMDVTSHFQVIFLSWLILLEKPHTTAFCRATRRTGADDGREVRTGRGGQRTVRRGGAHQAF
jgi:hypothetical protein